VEGGRAYLGRPAIGLGFKTEEREIASDQVAGVSKGRSSCASSEGPNGPREGITGATSTRRDATTDQRQKNQYRVAFPEESRGAAPMASVGGTESELAKRKAESPATEQWMEEVCERENCKQALPRVKANKGSPGIDGMTVDQLSGHLKEHWPAIREQLSSGSYTPQPVRRVEIAKPDGGVRQLGIPTVLDRFIQQAVMQILQRSWDGTFSEHRHGFGPKRSAHQAVEQAQQYQTEGYRWVVDVDLEKFFDRFNHDRLLAKIAERVSDKRLLRRIGAFLRAGAMENGLVSPAEEGTPQGGPLSPVLSNIVLNELDQELERRGQRFTRDADDGNIYVRSRRAGEPVMSSVTRLLTTKLKLRDNSEKSAVARPWERKFLGFSFPNHKPPKRRLAPKAVARFKERVRELTSRTLGISLGRMVQDLAEYLRGWIGYFGRCETPEVLDKLEKWLRRRLRSMVWKQWKRGTTRYRELRKRGIAAQDAAKTAGSSDGPWHLANTPALKIALPNAYFASLGLPELTAHG